MTSLAALQDGTEVTIVTLIVAAIVQVSLAIVSLMEGRRNTKLTAQTHETTAANHQQTLALTTTAGKIYEQTNGELPRVKAMLAIANDRIEQLQTLTQKLLIELEQLKWDKQQRARATDVVLKGAD